MKILKTTNNIEFMVDDEDFEQIKDLNWHGSTHLRRTAILGYEVSENKVFPLARLLIGVFDSKMVVDHINGDTFDNRKSNLRKCTHQQNCWNQKRSYKSKSKYKCVNQRGPNSFRAKISKDGKQYTIGTFKTAIDAAKAYNQKAIELFGEFASLNDV